MPGAFEAAAAHMRDHGGAGGGAEPKFLLPALWQIHLHDYEAEIELGGTTPAPKRWATAGGGSRPRG
ncbi:hypothetical protein AB0K52_10780 [Glycomyces sp. NPDC049804]|uniref:hypothetical protein n=1 Tax=Glycomyces sp. NPDC049804 TaxID=3154363 RepID=UPI003427DFA6